MDFFRSHFCQFSQNGHWTQPCSETAAGVVYLGKRETLAPQISIA